MFVSPFPVVPLVPVAVAAVVCMGVWMCVGTLDQPVRRGTSGPLHGLCLVPFVYSGCCVACSLGVERVGSSWEVRACKS